MADVRCRPCPHPNGARGDRPPENVAIRWEFQADNIIRTSPAVADGTVYVGSDDDTLMTIAEEPR